MLGSIKLQIILIFTFLLFITTNAQNSKRLNSKDKKYPEVSIPSTEKRVLHSDIINDDFEIYVSLPYKYHLSDTTYPVIFCLDANVKFGLISNVVNNLGTLTKDIPEILVIGIAYPLKGLEDWIINRNRDLTPTKKLEHEKYWVDRLSKTTGRDDIVIHSGGANKFLSFIDNELIPFTESNYRVSSKDRTLHGTSLGGLFALYALLHRPELFQRYFAVSPSINWDELYMYNLEHEFASSHKDLPIHLFMCVGELEREYYLNNTKKMEELLHSRNYPNLKIKMIVFENETHGSSEAASLGRGLKFLYAK